MKGGRWSGNISEDRTLLHDVNASSLPLEYLFVHHMAVPFPPSPPSFLLCTHMIGSDRQIGRHVAMDLAVNLESGVHSVVTRHDDDEVGGWFGSLRKPFPVHMVRSAERIDV